MIYLLRTSIVLSAFVILILPTLVFGQEGTSDRSFVPLTSLPGLDKVEDANNLADFFNQLFRIAIGVAATLAVFQIMHAGVKFMTNKGSISENEEARQLLQGAVFGLILVLSPVIVFGIINPKILELDFDVSQLRNNFTGVAPGSTTGTATTTGTSTSPTNPSTPTPGAFVFFQDFATVELAEAALQRCQIPEAHRDVIASYDKSGPTAGCPAGMQTCGAEQQRQVVKCESESKQFIVYKNGLGVWGGPWIYAPGENEKYQEFRNGCQQDRGQLEDDTDWLATDCGAHEAAIRATGVEGNITCKQREHYCKAI